MLTAIVTRGRKTQRIARLVRTPADARAALTPPAPPQTPKRLSPSAARQATARGYVVIAISLYVRDLAALDQQVAELHAAGIGRASRSWLIRMALRRLDLAALIAAERDHR